MEIITGILGFLQIANLVISLKDKLSTSVEEKLVAGDLIINIGHLLMSVSEDLEKNVYPHGKCSQMEVYAHQLKDILKNKLSHQDFDTLQQTLNQSLKVEKLLGELNLIDNQKREQNLNSLKTAAGKFIAFGEILKIS